MGQFTGDDHEQIEGREKTISERGKCSGSKPGGDERVCDEHVADAFKGIPCELRVEVARDKVEELSLALPGLDEFVPQILHGSAKIASV